MKISGQFIVIHLLLGLGLPTVSLAQPFFAGENSPDFQLPERNTGNTFRLHEHAGKILVLDFFAYWCAPCAFSSPDLERNVKDHYEEAGGNPAGVPVEVVSMNLEKEDPDSTDAFVEEVGMETVVDDVAFEAFSLYNDTGGIPLFVVINGLSNAEGHDQWEILLNSAGYPGAPAIREAVDSILPSETDPPPSLFADLPDAGGGWRESPWFGWVNTASAPLHLHEGLGWIFIPEFTAEQNFFSFDFQQGWIFTSPAAYPNIYMFRDAAWLAYRPGSDGWFWHFRDQKWKQYPNQ